MSQEFNKVQSKTSETTKSEPKKLTILERKQAITNARAKNLIAAATSQKQRLTDEALFALEVIDNEVIKDSLLNSYKELATACSGKWMFDFDNEDVTKQILKVSSNVVNPSGNSRRVFVNGNGKLNKEFKNKTVACNELSVTLDGDIPEVALARAGYKISKTAI